MCQVRLTANGAKPEAGLVASTCVGFSAGILVAAGSAGVFEFWVGMTVGEGLLNGSTGDAQAAKLLPTKTNSRR